MEFVLTAFVSFIAGLLTKGINININRKQDEVPEEYNESTVETLDPEIRRYYEQNHGQNNF